MERKFTLRAVIPATPERIYKAWLSTAGHSKMTGSPAKVAPGGRGKFTAWDGYISGQTLERKPFARIVQAWRTTDFPEASPDSRVEINLEPVRGGTQVTIVHSEFPEGQADDYKQGWQDYYFQPMKEYFQKQAGGG